MSTSFKSGRLQCAETVIPAPLDIQVPPTFPERYYDALVRSASQCAVKKHLEHPPVFEVRTIAVAAA